MKKEKGGLNNKQFSLLFILLLGSLFFLSFVSAAISLPKPPVSPSMGSATTPDNSVYPTGNLTANAAPSSSTGLIMMINWQIIWICLGLIFIIIVVYLIFYSVKKSNNSNISNVDKFSERYINKLNIKKS